MDMKTQKHQLLREHSPPLNYNMLQRIINFCYHSSAKQGLLKVNNNKTFKNEKNRIINFFVV